MQGASPPVLPPKTQAPENHSQLTGLGFEALSGKSFSLFSQMSGTVKEKEGDTKGSGTRGGMLRRGDASEEWDFYHWACNNRERWVQWQPLPSGVQTAVYTVEPTGYQLHWIMGSGTDWAKWATMVSPVAWVIVRRSSPFTAFTHPTVNWYMSWLH